MIEPMNLHVLCYLLQCAHFQTCHQRATLGSSQQTKQIAIAFFRSFVQGSSTTLLLAHAYDKINPNDSTYVGFVHCCLFMNTSIVCNLIQYPISDRHSSIEDIHPYIPE